MKQRRWWIGILIAFGVIVNYLDRSTMSIATKPIESGFHLSAGQMGIILSAFGWSYALLQIPVGALLDKVGVKWVIRLGMLLWSIACFITAAATGQGLLLLARVLLGFGEAPYFPAATKASAYWFPIAERARAVSLYDSESKLASAIGAPLLAWAVTEWSWRGGFIATGVLSVVYVIIFWAMYRNPSEDRRLSAEERAYIEAGGTQAEGEAVGGTWSNLLYLLRFKKVWGVFIGFAAYGYSWWLFLSWLPGYLEDQMHLSVLKTGWYAAVPWLVGFLAEMLVGGMLVDALIRRGRNPLRVRKTILVIGLLLGLSVIGAAYVHSAGWAVFWISLALGSLVCTSSVAYSVPTFIAPRGTVGVLTGFLTFGNNAMGIVAPIVTGFIVQATGSFMDAFLCAAGVLVIGILSYAFLLTDLDPISPMQRTSAGSHSVSQSNPL
ncbi:Sugar phosphate permease [Alicyclobacillus hesperidum]|uniref:Sugar phosphate permease n=1 Tax=Alicyclobacillus hesperidum TaxID=89784 RepID=A0A1H2R7Q3_9BACL|nr:MFS transporter [Alicyclobacillus hesperidum]SDW15228.1 Sugar phosphate permease [Alicyclobacillus hesperidum]